MSARIITCKACGKPKYHAARGLCRSCYQKKQYHANRDHELDRRRASRGILLDIKHAAICEALRDLLLPLIPEGRPAKHISWDQAAGIYNHNNPEPVHYLALCRAVQFQGDEWGLIAYPRPIGGVIVTREKL